MFRYLLFLLGILGALPALALTALAVVTPITVSGGIYLVGCWLILLGLICAPWRREYFLGLMGSGAIVILLMVGVRLILIRNQSASQNDRISVIELPPGTDTRGINWLVEERDTVLFGQEIMYRLGGVTLQEHDDLVAALAAAYADAAAAGGVGASPFMSTYLGLEKPNAFDAVVIEPQGERTPSTGVVFLHGFMGNVSVQCWEIAQAAQERGAVTVCPSTGWIGDWWEPDGMATIQATFQYLRARGIQRLYLGGFSNGGHGICRRISTLATEPGLKGLFFIAGVCGESNVREMKLPVLVIQGRWDERMSVEAARRFVDTAGAPASYVELDADHFLIVKQPRAVQIALGSWLRDADK